MLAEKHISFEFSEQLEGAKQQQCLLRELLETLRFSLSGSPGLKVRKEARTTRRLEKCSISSLKTFSQLTAHCFTPEPNKVPPVSHRTPPYRTPPAQRRSPQKRVGKTRQKRIG
eukprot:1666205-Pyramimonas_sp.AAC.1